MMKSFHKQRGFSMYNMIFYGVIIIFAGFMVTKLSSAYIDDYTLQKILTALEDENLGKKSPRAIKQLISQRLDINSVYGFNMDAIKVEKKKGKIYITADYEKRIPMVANLDMIAKFKYEIDFSE